MRGFCLIFIYFMFSTCWAMTAGLSTNDFSSVVRISAKDIDNGEDYTCLGTVISQNQIITAAHCIGSEQYFLKTHQVQVQNVRFMASRVRVHPNYKRYQNSIYDVAVLDFYQVDLSLLVKIHPLATASSVKNLDVGESLEIVGLNQSDSMVSSQVYLSKTNQYFMAINNKIFHPTSGDSGAPLFWKNPRTHREEQVGIHLFNIFDKNGTYLESFFVKIDRVWELLGPFFYFH